MTIINKEQFEARQKIAKREGWHRFMEQPATKMLISMLPPGDHTIEVLRVAWEDGFSYGAGDTMVEFLKIVIGKPGGPL